MQMQQWLEDMFGSTRKETMQKPQRTCNIYLIDYDDIERIIIFAAHGNYSESMGEFGQVTHRDKFPFHSNIYVLNVDFLYDFAQVKAYIKSLSKPVAEEEPEHEPIGVGVAYCGSGIWTVHSDECGAQPAEAVFKETAIGRFVLKNAEELGIKLTEYRA